MQKFMSDRTARQIARGLLAEGVDVSTQQIAAWRRGVAYPSAEKWPALAKVLGVKVEQISNAAIEFHTSKAA